MIKRFTEYINERLSSEVYDRASRKLKMKDHKNRASYLKNYANALFLKEYIDKIKDNPCYYLTLDSDNTYNFDISNIPPMYFESIEHSIDSIHNSDYKQYQVTIKANFIISDSYVSKNLSDRLKNQIEQSNADKLDYALKARDEQGLKALNSKLSELDSLEHKYNQSQKSSRLASLSNTGYKAQVVFPFTIELVDYEYPNSEDYIAVETEKFKLYTTKFHALLQGINNEMKFLASSTESYYISRQNAVKFRKMFIKYINQDEFRNSINDVLNENNFSPDSYLDLVDYITKMSINNLYTSF